MDPQNLELLLRIVQYLEPAYTLELGTFRGRTTYNLAMNTNGTVITVDLPAEQRTGQEFYYGTDVVYFLKGDDVGGLFKGTDAEQRIRQIYANVTSNECENLLDEILQGSNIDLAFIDTSHDYDTVRECFEGLVLPRLSNGGVVVFDDYNRPLTHVGVSHYLMQKAHYDGLVFYWYAPLGNNTNAAIFLNLPDSIRHNWREEKI